MDEKTKVAVNTTATVIAPGTGVYPAFSKNAYQWIQAEGAYAGTPAQNNNNPLGTFTNHVVLKVGETYYDPSYGLTYTSPTDFRKQSVAGSYYLLPKKNNNGEFVWNLTDKVVMSSFVWGL